MRTIWAAIAVLFLAGDSASGCPTCVRALSTQDARAQGNAPLAYNASIALLAGMPLAMTTVFGVTFWRLARRRGSSRNTGRGPCPPFSKS